LPLRALNSPADVCAVCGVQYTAGGATQGRDGCSVGEVAAALVAQLYALLDGEDMEHHHSDGSTPASGQFDSIAVGGGEAVAMGQYAFAAPIGTVFTFGPDTSSPTPHTSPIAAQGRGGMGRGSHLAKPSWMT
jgi:hypothetical protein